MEDLIKALQIFLKYGNKDRPTWAEHDVFIVNIEPSIVSEEDIKALDELGFGPACGDDWFISSRFGDG